MKAAVLVDVGCPLDVDEVLILERLDVGHVLIELNYAGITNEDVIEIDGLRAGHLQLPNLVGTEAVGRVIDVGVGVSKVREGERVVVHSCRGEGILSPSYCYKWNSPNGRKLIESKDIVAFATSVVVSECFVTRIPDLVNDLTALPLMGGAMLKGMGCVERMMKPMMGQSVVVIGGNGVGLSVVRCAAMRNMIPIMCVDDNFRRLRIATVMGAHFTERDYRKVPSSSYDYVVVAEYFNDSIELACRAVKRNGSIFYVGDEGLPGDAASLSIKKLGVGVSLEGCSFGKSVPSVDIQRMFQLGDKLMLEEMVTDTYRLENVNDAIDVVRSGITGGRVVLKLKEDE